MILKKILNGIKVLDTKNFNEEINIENIYYHSKEVTKNSLFVAMKGAIVDGHKYIKSAVEQGAICVIVEDFVEVDVAQIKVENSRIALSQSASNFYEDPSKKLKICGITATNGKTTTSFMLDSIYKEAGYNTGLIGTVLTRYNNVVIPSVLTTPESLDLQKIFRDMLDSKVERVTMEVSSSAEEMNRVANVDFDIVTFNNFSSEHIDQHGSLESYYNEKSKLIRNASKNAIAILNMDFKEIASLQNETDATVLKYSLNNDNYDFSITNLDLSSGFGKFSFKINRDIILNNISLKKSAFDVDLSVAGYSSVMNAVVSIIVALIEGIDVSIIQKALKNFTGVERRFEMIYNGNFKVIDDHYANVKNIEVTLETLSKMKYNNLIVLYAIRGSRGVTVNRDAALETAKWFKILKPKKFFATRSEETVSKKDLVLEEEIETFKSVMDENNIEYKIFPTLKEGIDKILKNVSDGDLVLLAGCQGMDKGAEILYNSLKNSDLKNLDIFKSKIDNRIC